MSNITEILTCKTANELAIELRNAVRETRESTDAADTANAEAEVSAEMVEAWQTFGGSPADEALTAPQADELMTYILETELLKFPSL